MMAFLVILDRLRWHDDSYPWVERVVVALVFSFILAIIYAVATNDRGNV